MAEEKILILNLRKDTLKAPRTRRSRDEILILKRKVAKFSKNGKVKISEKLSEKIWSRGGTNSVKKLKVKITKKDDGSASVDLAA